MTTRRAILIAVGVSPLLVPRISFAQRPARVGIVINGSLTAFAPRVDALREGLRNLGYVEGRTIVYELRAAEGDMDRVPSLTAELVRLNVDVIVAHGGVAVQRVRQTTATVPIVMGNSSDPVRLGVAASLARPGGNVTGLMAIFQEVTVKGLEVLHDTIPSVTRVAILYAREGRGMDEAVKETQARAGAMGIDTQAFELHTPDGLPEVFSAIAQAGPGALIVFDHNWFVTRQKQLAQLAMEHRLPTMFSQPEFIDAGGLISYGARLAAMWQRAAYFVDKILRGANPADLPIEQPTHFDLVINLETARALGIDVPQSVLFRADRVIE
jgi:putative tryptophan/tyrosine transport system substrate-binding protein